MQPFAYSRPRSIEDAVRLLAAGDAAVLAGGTDLLSLMKASIERPKRLVSLSGIWALRQMQAEKADGSGDIRIGAAASLSSLEHPDLRASFPALAHALEGFCSPQIRNMGTLGGELLQRPRCWYFRSGFGLLAQQDGRSMVVDGDNRYHAIFGDGPAHFVSASTLAPPLIALDARLYIMGPKGARVAELASFYRSPRTETEREVDLAPDELLVAVQLAESSKTTKNSRREGVLSATYEVRERQSIDWPLVTASVAMRREGERVTLARVVLGHVAPTPIISAAAAKAIEGGPITEERAAAAGRAAVQGASPLSRNGYKVQLAQVAVKRALLRAAEEA